MLKCTKENFESRMEKVVFNCVGRENKHDMESGEKESKSDPLTCLSNNMGSVSSVKKTRLERFRRNTEKHTRVNFQPEIIPWLLSIQSAFDGFCWHCMYSCSHAHPQVYSPDRQSVDSLNILPVSSLAGRRAWAVDQSHH